MTLQTEESRQEEDELVALRQTGHRVFSCAVRNEDAKDKYPLADPGMGDQAAVPH